MKKAHFNVQFILLLSLLIAILIQGFSHIIPMKPLKGYVSQPKEQKLTFKTYYDGSYQEYLTQKAKLSTGFREFFIRNYNQVLYSCFKVITNQHIVEGYDHDVFLKMYLDDITGRSVKAHYGSVEKAKEVARNNVEKTKKLVQDLYRNDKDFLFVFAPTKTYVYSEKMPDYYQEQITDFSLEEYYIELFKENNIPILDFYHYFRSIKDTVAYPLYSKWGSHWAASTIPYVADSILNMLESITDYELPSIRIVDQHVSSTYHDYDVEQLHNMNLLFPVEQPAIPNPEYCLTDTAGKDHPSLLVIGDSYFDQFMFGCFRKAFKEWNFWQYNKNTYGSRWWKVDIKQINTKNIVKNADIVMAVFTAPMLYNYMCGFIDSTRVQLQEIEEEKILHTMDVIKANKDWYDHVVEQAEQRGMSVEENLRVNAKYFIENRKSRKHHGIQQ